MLSTLVDRRQAAFRLHADVLDDLQAACLANRDIASYRQLGTSEDGRPIVGITLGRGPLSIGLVAGAHADEPVGPETLRTFVVSALRHRKDMADLLDRCTFVIVPHVNPDGEARNRPWIRSWPDPAAYIGLVQREAPGRDIEFGYPSMRVENELVSEFLATKGPYAAHLSLHGMGFAEGGLLLIDRRWGYRTADLQDGFRAALEEHGLGLHDENRQGEKGFFYLGAGFWTTPEGQAMRTHFRSLPDEKTAALFHDSSMDFVRSLGGDPLCLVTEIPLFVVTPDAQRTVGVPHAYREFKAALPGIRRRLERGRSADDAIARFLLRPVGLADAMEVHLRVVELAVETVR